MDYFYTPMQSDGRDLLQPAVSRFTVVKSVIQSLKKPVLPIARGVFLVNSPIALGIAMVLSAVGVILPLPPRTLAQATFPSTTFPQGVLPQGAFPQGVFPQGAFPQGVLPQGAFPQGVLPQGAFPQGAFPQGVLPQGILPQGAFPQGVLPQGAFPQGAFPQGVLPQGAFPQGVLPQGALPQGAFPQGAFPQGVLPQGAFPQGVLPQGAFPQGVLPPVPPAPGFSPSPLTPGFAAPPAAPWINICDRHNTAQVGSVTMIGRLPGAPYAVVVPGENPEALALVRQCVPDAFISKIRRGKYIQAGVFRDRATAEYLSVVLREQNLDARVIYLP